MPDIQIPAYFGVLMSRMSMEEFAYACHKALEVADFHKVPLPSVMLKHAYEYRTEQDQQAQRRAKLAHVQGLIALTGEKEPGRNGNAWAVGHRELFEVGLAAVGKELEAAAYCRTQALQETSDSADWSREAVWYQRMDTSPHKRDMEAMSALYPTAGEHRHDPRTF